MIMRYFGKRLKAQYTLYAMFMTVITIIAYLVGGYPILKTVIDASIPGMDETTAAVVGFSPLLIFLFILWGAMVYVMPRYEQPPNN